MRGLQHAEDVAEGRPWRRDHPFVGERARRYFPVPGVDGGRIAPYDGKIDGWLSPEADDPPLWHLQMADGDDEELDEVEARTAIQHFAEGQHMLPGSIEEAEAGAEAWAAAAEAIKGTEAAREAAAAEPKPEADAAMEGRQLTEYSMLRLWATSECRERWRGALQPPPQAPPQAQSQSQPQPQSQSQSQSPPPSFATVALCAHALRAHADAFAAAASKKRPSERTSLELESWYHAG